MSSQTVVLIKPDGVKRGLVGEVLHRFERVGLKKYDGLGKKRYLSIKESEKNSSRFGRGAENMNSREFICLPSLGCSKCFASREGRH